MNVEGFHEDCMDLISKYCSRSTTDFQQFCDDWKEKGFHYVFYGHAYQHELLLCTENCFVILKNIFNGSSTINERLATFYLMYAMYFKQPTKDFCKFRFTLVDWKKMKSFYDAVSVESNYLQARTIFWRLWQSHAFRFVECDMEHYPETIQLHRLGNDGHGDFSKINSTILGTLNSLQNENNGILSAIGTLQLGYNEMKDHFASNMTECAHFKSIDVIDELSSQLDKMKKLFENKYESSRFTSRRRRKESSSLAGSSMAIKASETDYDNELNVSYSSYSESNDEQESTTERSEEDAMDQCLNIGSKRYYLKRRALQNETGDLHRFKSSVMEVGSSPKKKRNTNKKRKTTEETQQSDKSSLPERSQVSLDDTSGNIVINHPKKVYNRHSKQYKSTVRKQFSECPSEISVEIDTNSPRKRGKLKQ